MVARVGGWCVGWWCGSCVGWFGAELPGDGEAVAAAHMSWPAGSRPGGPGTGCALRTLWGPGYVVPCAPVLSIVLWLPCPTTSIRGTHEAPRARIIRRWWLRGSGEILVGLAGTNAVMPVGIAIPS